MRVIDLFAGVGGWSEGARQAGHEVIAAVEYDQTAAEYYARNHGQHVICADILSVNPGDMPAAEILLASPPCPNFSMAKRGGAETEHDIALARRVADFVSVLQPRFVFIENVYQYRKSRSWALLQDALAEAGYWFELQHLNSADFGVPQTRRRMIVRSTRGNLYPPLPGKTKWGGWYDAIEDILDTLPASDFADWQRDRLPVDFEEFLLGAGTLSAPRAKGQPAQTITANHNQLAHIKAFLVGGGNAGAYRGSGKLVVRQAEQPSPTVVAGADRAPIRAFLISSQNSNAGNGLQPTIRLAHEPSNTVTATATKGQSRAWLGLGNVKSMTPRALARFQSFPDETLFPETAKEACRLIGNAVPPRMAAALLKELA